MYGKLFGRKLEDNCVGERVAVDIRKRYFVDFVFWKVCFFSFLLIFFVLSFQNVFFNVFWQIVKEGEVFWESFWGRGRFGWYIECSAMSAVYLGYSFDIYGGGMDFVFFYYENEIVQSCVVCDSSDISYWIYNGFVIVDLEKMFKFLGNFFIIRQVKKIFKVLNFFFFKFNINV